MTSSPGRPVESGARDLALRRILARMLRLDPTAPALWRTPTALQLGEPARVVLDPVSPAVEAVLRALTTGATRAVLAGVAGDLPEAELDALLRVLRPALLPERTPPRAPLRRVVDAPPGLAAVLSAALAPLGHLLEPAAGDPDAVRATPALVLVAGHHVLPPARYVRWLAADVPHLAVTIGDADAVVGPLVVPGRTPCLRCRDEHRLAAEPWWPAVAAQLLRRRDARGAGDPLLVAEVATRLARAIDARSAGRATGLEGRSERIDRAGGAISRREQRWHERCSCCWPDRGRDPRGTVTAPAPTTAPATPSPPRTAAAAPSPA